MRNIIIVTGGAGFVGTNLIKKLIDKTQYKIISIDNYSSGVKENHVNSKRIKYIKSDTAQIAKTLNLYKKNTFNFSFWRICSHISKFFENGRMY